MTTAGFYYFDSTIPRTFTPPLHALYLHDTPQRLWLVLLALEFSDSPSLPVLPQLHETLHISPNHVRLRFSVDNGTLLITMSESHQVIFWWIMVLDNR